MTSAVMSSWRTCRCVDYGQITEITEITGTGYELHNFTIRSRRQTFLPGAALPLCVTHQAVDLMEA